MIYCVVMLLICMHSVVCSMFLVSSRYRCCFISAYSLTSPIHFLIRKCYRWPNWWLCSQTQASTTVQSSRYIFFGWVFCSPHACTKRSLLSSTLLFQKLKTNTHTHTHSSRYWIIAFCVNGDNDKWPNVINSKMIFLHAVGKCVCVCQIIYCKRNFSK